MAGETLLVVEDSQGMREYVRDTLSAAGYRVLEAGDGTEALDALDATPNVKLIVTDLVMPNLDGFGLIDTVRGRASRRALPIIVLTAEHDGECVERAQRRGANAAMTKPFSRKDLLETVERLLD